MSLLQGQPNGTEMHHVDETGAKIRHDDVQTCTKQWARFVHFSTLLMCREF